jgi:2-keto-4-pentenoate hydratase
MTATIASAIADQIEADTRARKRFEPLRIDGRALDLTEAYAVQAEIVARAQARGAGSVIGYKVGLTSQAMQKFCGVSEPVVGRILRQRVRHNDSTLPLNQFHRLGLESELVLRVGKPVPVLPEETDPSDLLDCVDAIAAGFEIVEDRGADYQQLDGFSIIAENSWNMGMVLGSPTVISGSRNLANLVGSLYINDALIGTASSAEVMRGPLSVLAWLARFTRAMGFQLLPGQWVMTGSIIPTQFATAHQHFRFELGDLAPVQVRVE